MKGTPFSIKDRLISFRYAFNGIVIAFRDEHNTWIHALAAFVALIAGLVLQVSPLEWIALVICIAVVFSFEIMNAAIERLADAFSVEFHPLIKQSKDLAAGAVLVAAVASTLVGVLIFLPKILALW